MDTAEAIEALCDFNEKADELAGSRFVQSMLNEDSGVRIAGHRDVGTIAFRYGPDNESLRAMTNTLRLFGQDNDAISLYRIARHYAVLPVSPDLRQRFNRRRKELNNELDTASYIVSDDKPLTRRGVWETFAYGHISHTNPKHRPLYKDLAGNPIAYPVVENEFCRTAMMFIAAILDIRELNKEAIAALVAYANTEAEATETRKELSR